MPFRGKIIILLCIFFPLYVQAKDIEPVLKLALKAKLYERTIWKRLIHYDKHKARVYDPSFLLSFKNFSPKNELILTIKNFYNNPESICKFPARYYWLKHQLGEKLIDLSFNQCPQFMEYKKKAPADNIYLVFAGENLLSPTSFLGHVFLKISGNNYKNKYVEHAISFYTEINTFNIPYLMYKVFFAGMNGYFSLLPYRKVLNNYLYYERRNIWEYKLKLKPFYRKLIYYHIWELKDVKLKYVFTTFNCATLIHDILALSKKDFTSKDILWITPKDVIKDAYKNKVIETSKLIPSPEWFARSLEELIPNKKIEYIKLYFKQKKFNKVQSLLSNNLKEKIIEVSLINAYSDYLFLNENLSYKEYKNIKIALSQIDVPTYYFDISNFKSPAKTPQDSQIGIGYINNGGKNLLSFYFLPISHDITDDNRQYFSESSVKLGEMEILIKDKYLKLNKLTFFYVKSIKPYSYLVDGKSWEIKLNLEDQYNKDLRAKKVLNFSGGVGISKSFYNENFMTFGMLNAGLASNISSTFLYIYPEIGFLIYDFKYMKTIFSYQFVYNQFNTLDFYNKITLKHAIFIKNKYKLLLSYKIIGKNRNNKNIFELKFVKYF